MYNFRQRDESSQLWKFLFTAKRNTLYSNRKYWHMRTLRGPYRLPRSSPVLDTVAYYDAWEFAAQLGSLSELPQYAECISHMPPTYFTPDWALGRHDSPPPLSPVDTHRIITSLTNRVEYPRYSTPTTPEGFLVFSQY
jgi:hypothetical protein